MKRWWLEEGARKWVEERRKPAAELSKELKSQEVSVVSCSPDWYTKGWYVVVDLRTDIDKVPAEYLGAPVKTSLNRPRERQLLSNLRASMPELEKLLNKANSHRSYEDSIYRFYHHSFKVYWLQGFTQEIADALMAAAPEGARFNEQYLRILKNGTGRSFGLHHNRWWDFNTRPIVEAFFHTKYFLEMAVKYAKELDPEGPMHMMLPSGYATLLYFYNMR